MEVDAVPGGDCGGENAGFGTEFGVGVVSDAKAITWESFVSWVVREGRRGFAYRCAVFSYQGGGGSRRTV